MKKTLKAKEEFFYGGATRKVGDLFEASDPDANILCVMSRAEDVTDSVQPSSKIEEPPVLQTAQMKAEESVQDVPQESTDEPPRKRYRRRDMRAEE